MVHETQRLPIAARMSAKWQDYDCIATADSYEEAFLAEGEDFKAPQAYFIQIALEAAADEHRNGNVPSRAARMGGARTVPVTTTAPKITKVKYEPSGSMKGKTIGHTFSKHGSNNTHELTMEAKNSKSPQGQWVDDVKAEEFISKNLHLLKNGAKTIELPAGLGRVINPDGSTTAATHVRLVPSGSGVKTAYPGTKTTLPE